MTGKDELLWRPFLQLNSPYFEIRTWIIKTVFLQKVLFGRIFLLQGSLCYFSIINKQIMDSL